MARTIKAVLKIKKKNIFTLKGKTKVKIKTEKIHKQKKKREKKKGSNIRSGSGRCYNTSPKDVFV